MLAKNHVKKQAHLYYSIDICTCQEREYKYLYFWLFFLKGSGEICLLWIELKLYAKKRI